MPIGELSRERFEELCRCLLRIEGLEFPDRTGTEPPEHWLDPTPAAPKTPTVLCLHERVLGLTEAQHTLAKFLVSLGSTERLLLLVNRDVDAEVERWILERASPVEVEIWDRSELDRRTSRVWELLSSFFEVSESGEWLAAESRGLAVGGDVSNSLVATGDGNFQARDVHLTQVFQVPLPEERARGSRPLVAPAPPAQFTGREEVILRLVDQLSRGESVGVTALQGMGGIGKTAVALKVAERLQDQDPQAFPGGILWTRLAQDPDPLTVLDSWARAADPRADFSELQDPARRADAVRQLLGRRGRHCAVLDDVWKPEDVRPLLEALPPDTVLLITTRLGDVAKKLRCQVHSLDTLSIEESFELLRKHLPDLGGYTREARQILEMTGGLPLALEIVVGLVDEGGELPDLLDRLRRQERIRVLSQADQREDSLEACFSLSYRSLESDDRRRFRALGAFAEAPFSELAAAAVWGEEACDPQKLQLLLRRNLLQRDAAHRLHQHSLLASYARVLLDRHGEVQEVRGRHAQHYHQRISSGSVEEIEQDYPQIRHGWAHVEQDSEVAEKYADACVGFRRRRGHWLEREIQLSVRPLDSETFDARGRILNNIAVVYSALGRRHEALNRYREASEVLGHSDDHRGRGVVLSNRAAVLKALGESKAASQTLAEALTLYRQLGDRASEAMTLNNLGLAYFSLGETDDSLASFEEAFQIFESLDDPIAQVFLLFNLGFMLHSLGRSPEALSRLETCVRLSDEMGHPELERHQELLREVRSTVGEN